MTHLHVALRTRTIALLAILTVLVAACGGEGADPAETSEPVAADSTTIVAADRTTPVTETTAPDINATTEALPAEPEEVTVTHTSGESTVPYRPETVVVFEYAALDTLDALGVDVAGVVQATLPAHLSAYGQAGYTNVGTLFEPDFETINSLDPDLVIIGGRSSATYPDMLAADFPTIDLTYDWVDPMTSITTNTEILGQIFGLEDEVADALASVSTEITAVQSAAAEAGTALIVMTSAGEVTAYGSGSRFGVIHDVLGVTPAVEDVEEATHGDAISFEFILEANPDILYVIDRDAAIGEDSQPAAEVLDNELVHQTTAWQNDAVFYLDPGAWYLSFGGLNSASTMLAEIGASLE